jgi:hypothetical protein
MLEIWRKQRLKAAEALLATGNEAVAYFTRRDLFGEDTGNIEVVWTQAEPRRILQKQSPDGYWKGLPEKTEVYPENHAELVATFKEFRILVERYQFRRENAKIARAGEYLFSFQTPAGDIRGFISNQYATYYTGYILSLLITAGYLEDPRVENGMQWLLKMRQDDGGWSIPLLTHNFDGQTMNRLTSSLAEPVEPDRTRPFSHNWTDMVLRAFAVHPLYRQFKEPLLAGSLLKSTFFQPDVYTSYQAASYWTRFLFWWPNLLTAMESLFWLGFTPADPDIQKGLKWFISNQREDGLWECVYDGKNTTRNKRYEIEKAWISLRVCRMLTNFLGRIQ